MVRYNQEFQQQINDEQINQEAWIQLSNQIQKQDMKLFDNFRPFGYAFFTNRIQKQYNIKLFNKNLMEELSKENWFIKVKDEKEKNRLQLIFLIMIESQATSIQFKSYPMPNILKTISNVGFHQLTKLNLYKMGIVSIQALSFVDAPNLKTLNFIYNQVYQFKSLKKANFQLESLFIYVRSQTDFFKKQANFNLRIDDSSRWDFNLKELRLQKRFYNKIITEDLSFLGKLKHKSNLYLDTNISMNTKRILQRKLFQKYFDETNIKLHLIEIYDDRQFPVQRYQTLKNFNAFHVRMQY